MESSTFNALMIVGALFLIAIPLILYIKNKITTQPEGKVDD